MCFRLQFIFIFYTYKPYLPQIRLENMILAKEKKK